METKQFYFDTFSGNDITVTLLFPYRDDGDKLHTIVVGNVAAISGSIQTEGTPRWVMGEANPQGYSQGKRLVSGSFVIETLNRSFVNEIQELLPNDYTNIIEGIDISSVEANDEVDRDQVLRFADQLPAFDILISASKEGDPSIQASRKIIGCKIFSETAGIGLSTLDSQEAYQFLAKEITPFTRIENEQVV